MPFYCRKPTRIPDFDYASQHYYFVTVCTKDKKCIFGTPKTLNSLGKIAWQEFMTLDSHYEGVRVDNFVIMPNHVHGIIEIVKIDGRRTDLNNILGAYKAGVTRKIHALQPDLNVWQRSFHDHVIRNQAEYEKIWNYVTYNGQKWESDCFYPRITD